MAPHPDIDLNLDANANANANAQALSPMAARALHLAKSFTKREEYKSIAAAGSQPAANLSGPGFQVLFALIAVGMTLTAIWFFFWAKNGGFKWREDDWEDYKSTVLRRKGPDGKTLSNATKSTRLGGGSVVHGGSYGAPTSIGYTDETGTSADPNELRDAEEGKSRHGMRGGDGRRHKKHRRDHTNDYNDPDLDGYRHEKAARVGGINRQADGEYTDYSPTEPSDLGSNVSGRPLVIKGGKDPKKEAKEKEMRARERMKNAKAAEKEAAKKAAAEAKARKDAEKLAAKRAKAEQKQAKKSRSVAGLSDVPEMVEARAMTEYTGAYTEYTAPSEAPAPAPAPAPARAPTSKGPSGPRRAPPSAAYSFTTGDDDQTVYTGVYTDDGKTEARTEAAESSYYSDYRPKAERARRESRDRRQSRDGRESHDRSSRSRPAGSRSRPASQTRSRQQRSSRPPQSYAQSDIFTAANGESRGHMSYPCHIPGLSDAGSVGVSESVSQVGGPRRGGRDVMDGYRRGGARGRRDSLSDSDS